MAGRTLEIISYGITPYNEVWEQQKELQRKLIDGIGFESLIICQHKPVITKGTSTKEASLLAPPSQLAEAGIELFEIERGGDITFHGPGQIVCYPIINLALNKKDVHWYMRALEGVIIETLSGFGISSQRIDGRTGVWISPGDPNYPPRKIASIGVRISRWCTMHGFALNISSQEKGFSYINPCGYTDIAITSMNQETVAQKLPRPTSFLRQEVEPAIIGNFLNTFGFSNPIT